MKKIIAVGLLFMLVVTSCNLTAAGEETATVAPVDVLRTSAAKTVDALSTSLAINKTPIPTSVGPTTQPVVTNTLAPSATPLPTATPIPPLPTVTTMPCDIAAFVRDVTIPDGTVFFPNTVFTKTWEIKNVGSCTWNSNYALVFHTGNIFGAPASKPLMEPGQAVTPNQTIKISVQMTAPGSLGKFESYWRLKNPAGEFFGVGPEGNRDFFASIVVSDQQTFLEGMCSAEWRNASAQLPCPGQVGDKAGSVTKVDAPVFSSGYEEDEPGILMIPQAVTDGMIVGKFPPMVVPAKASFVSVVVCAADSPRCNAKVVLTSQVGSDPEKTLFEVDKQADDDATLMNVDLALKGLVGKTVVFRLYVKANGTSSDDRIFWISPQLKVAP